MIILKSTREIELMRHAGKIVALVHEKMAEVIRPGISTEELDEIAYQIITENDATPSFKGYNGFPSSICASVNDVLVHGIPNKKALLKSGDIISIDVGACYKGYHGDSAWTYAVGEVDSKIIELMKITKDSLFIGIEKAIPGNHVGDISQAVGEYIYKHGFTVPLDYTGHGIGQSIHEDPAVPNVGEAGRGALLKPGMVIAIEPMAHMGKRHTKVLKDNWTVVTRDGSIATHYEHTIVITENGNELLTIIPEKGGQI